MKGIRRVQGFDTVLSLVGAVHRDVFEVYLLNSKLVSHFVLPFPSKISQNEIATKIINAT